MSDEDISDETESGMGRFRATYGAIDVLAKAGVSMTDILGGGLAATISLTVAGRMQAGEAAGTIAAMKAQFGLSSDQLPHLADLIAEDASKGGSVEDMGRALSEAGATAANAGWTIDETTAALAGYASSGVIGNDAGQRLRTILTLSALRPAKAEENSKDRRPAKQRHEMSDAEGMESVLEDHHFLEFDEHGHCVCACGETVIGEGEDWEEICTHIAAELANAGYGSVHDAWAEGHAASDDAWETPRDICDPPVDTTNPYKETR